MRKYLRIVDRNRATKWTRLANFIIDRVIFNLSFMIIGFIGVFIDKLLGSYYISAFFLKLSEVNRLVDIVITSLLFFVYTFLMEYFTKGRTIAKYITGTKVITTDGQIPTLNEFFYQKHFKAGTFRCSFFFGRKRLAQQLERYTCYQH